jgi:hypothetical protein
MVNQALSITAGCSGIVGGILWFLAASGTPTPSRGHDRLTAALAVIDEPIPALVMDRTLRLMQATYPELVPITSRRD